MKLITFLLLFNGLVSVGVSNLQTVFHRYYLTMTQVNWTSAQSVCRGIYTDLATVVTNNDWLSLTKETESKGFTGSAWIGLYNDFDSWRWSLNELPLKNVSFKAWASGEPDNGYGIHKCVVLGYLDGWWDIPCDAQRPFACYDASLSGSAKFIGISTPLTWSDALTYCRTHHTDLASCINSSDYDLLVTIKNTIGDSWIGLYRDSWKWSDGTNATNLPWAPGQPDNLGRDEHCAMVTNGKFHDESCTGLSYYFCHTIFLGKKQIMKLQVKSDGSVYDSAVQSSILEQIKKKLEEKGMKNFTVTWKVQPDGNVFQNKNKDDL